MKLKYDFSPNARNILQASNDNVNICKNCNNYGVKETDYSNKQPPLTKKSKLKKNKEYFFYNFGARYPRSIKQRHKKCNGDSNLVPKNMGWLWNIKTYGIDKVQIFSLLISFLFVMGRFSSTSTKLLELSSIL